MVSRDTILNFVSVSTSKQASIAGQGRRLVFLLKEVDEYLTLLISPEEIEIVDVATRLAV